MDPTTSGPHKTQQTEEPWIDRLSKALASRSSRRIALKTLAASIIAGLLGSSITNRLTSAASTTPPPIPHYCPTCGTCIACDFNTTTGTGTCGSCDNSCPDAQLCAQANQDKMYKELADYLDNQGFQPDKVTGLQSKRDVKALLLSTNGTLEVSSVGLRYTNPKVSDQTAELYYTVAGSSIYVSAVVIGPGATSYGLYIDANGNIQQVAPQPLQTQSNHPSASTGREVPSNSFMLSEHAGFLAVTVPATITGCGVTCEVICAATGIGCTFGCAALCAIPSSATGPALPASEAACAAWCANFGCLPVGFGCSHMCDELLCTCKPPCDSCSSCFNRKCSSSCTSTNPNCCNGSCINMKTDPNNCGSCGHACSAGQLCVNGTCTTPCTSLGSSCSTDLTCCDHGVCQNGKCCLLPGIVSAPVCQQNSDCCSGVCCTKPGTSYKVCCPFGFGCCPNGGCATAC